MRTTYIPKTFWPQDLAADAPFVDGVQRVLFNAGAVFGGLAMDPPAVRGTARGVEVARPLRKGVFCIYYAVRAFYVRALCTNASYIRRVFYMRALYTEYKGVFNGVLYEDVS